MSRASPAVAVIVAAGKSQRMRRDKLWIDLGGVPVIAHTLGAFQRCPAIDSVVLVVSPETQRRFAKLKAQNSKLAAIVPGGRERQDSVWRGLLALPPRTAITVIHDGARPCVTPQLISRTVAAARKFGAAIAAAKITDTVKEIRNSKFEIRNCPRIARTLDRSRIWSAQTPQAFRADLIRHAYARVIASRLTVTDDAAAVELLRHPVHLVESDSTNVKITRPADVILARQILCKLSS